MRRLPRPAWGLALGSLCAMLVAQASSAQRGPDEAHASSAAASHSELARRTGLAALAERIGLDRLPDGAGIDVGHVEARDGGPWTLDFADPEFAEKSIVAIGRGAGSFFGADRTAALASAHATRAARLFFGSDTGISPGVSSIATFEARNWLGAGFLWGAGPAPPCDVAPIRVFNNSWIGRTGALDPLYLRKLDWAIAEQDLVVVHGVANGPGPLEHTLLVEAYNGLAVGRSDGRHAAGRTAITSEGAGRQKPELVAPGAATSWATPLVSGAASLLLDVARTERGLAHNPRAQSALLVKALLLCGAEKPLVWSNGAPSSGPLRGFTRTPLDPVLGAGELWIDRSHRILTALEQPGATSASGLSAVRAHGWNVVPIGPGESRFWRFDFASEKQTFDAVCVWHRHVDDDFERWSLADCNLRLWRVSAATEQLVALVGEGGSALWEAGNVVSHSPADNVELIHLRGLAPGRYALEAWRAPEGVAEPTRAASDRRPVTLAVAWSAAARAPEITCAPSVALANGVRIGSAREPSAHAHRSDAPATDEPLEHGLVCRARIDSIGSASLSDPDRFELIASELPPDASGSLVWGLGGAQLPFERGLLCVNPLRGSIRAVPANPVASDAACLRTLIVDGRAWLQTHGDPALVPGARVHVQFWFRSAWRSLSPSAAPSALGMASTPALRFDLSR